MRWMLLAVVAGCAGEGGRGDDDTDPPCDPVFVRDGDPEADTGAACACEACGRPKEMHLRCDDGWTWAVPEGETMSDDEIGAVAGLHCEGLM